MKAVPLNRYLVFASIAVGGCAVDLATKRWIFGHLGMPGGPIWWIWPNRFGFQTSLNEGALFGLGQGWVAIFALLSVVAAVGILVWLFGAGAARDLVLTIALACITAGILGNLYDRLGYSGLVWANHPAHHLGEPVHAVRDWILVIIFGWPWPNFNIADSLLLCGAGLLLIHAWRIKTPEPDGGTAAQSGAPGQSETVQG